MPKTIVVINHRHAGYRRAGMGLHLGRNELDLDALSPEQLAQLVADPHLSVLTPIADADPEGPLGDGDVPASVAPMPSHYVPVIAAQSPAPAAPSKPARKRSTKGA